MISPSVAKIHSIISPPKEDNHPTQHSTDFVSARLCCLRAAMSYRRRFRRNLDNLTSAKSFTNTYTLSALPNTRLQAASSCMISSPLPLPLPPTPRAAARGPSSTAARQTAAGPTRSTPPTRTVPHAPRTAATARAFAARTSFTRP